MIRTLEDVKLHTAGVGRLTQLVLASVILLPSAVWAQQASGIAGVVRDISDAVLPGVTVEAASPVLIEKVRAVVSDGEGRYNIVDLRPGTYTVTFRLAGFSTVRREGIELTSGFTATVNANLQVGALEETITVTGASPLVDTTNVRQQSVVSEELLAALPSGAKGFMGIARLIPGMSGGTDSGGASGIYASNSAHVTMLHGKIGTKMSYDGMQTSGVQATGLSSYIMNPATVEETTVETGGISAESDVSGLRINLIPKQGGNLFSFGADAIYTNEHLQNENLTDELRAIGISTTSKLMHLYDANVTVGGPIKKDRLWFFAATRFLGSQNQIAGIYFNKTQGDPCLCYTPDLNRPAYRKEWLKSVGGRMTWQVSPKHKAAVFADPQSYQTRGVGENIAPEAQSTYAFWPVGLYQATWSSPVTNRLLFEAGVSLARNLFTFSREQTTDIFGFTVKETDISVLEASTGLRYNAKNSYRDHNQNDRYVERFSVSYITGSHAFKIGFQLQQHILVQDRLVNGDVNYTFFRGVPTTITQYAQPYLLSVRTKADLGLFAQDQWTLKRLTLNYGLRLDYFNGYAPAIHLDAGQFVGARDFARLNNIPNWTDLNPRLGGSYDLLGTGRTALKASFGRYVGKMATTLAAGTSPISTSVDTVNRTWTDMNGNRIPDCDLRDFGLHGECGAISNINFGNLNPNATQYADDLIHGFGTRDYFWDLSAEVQQQLGSRVSATIGYYRNWSDQFGGLPLQVQTTGIGYGWPTGAPDNLAVTPADYSPYCITAPMDPRLPNGGGYQVCGLYDVSPEKFGQGIIRNERASKYGNGKSRTSDFFGVSLNSRFGGGIEFGGSLDTGRTVEDLCFVVDSPQELLNCRTVTPFKGQTQIKVHGSYPLPLGLVVSGVFQNLSGVQYLANYTVSNEAIAPSLGRNLGACGTRAVCAATATVPLIPPMTQFEPRQTLIDLRLTKLFSFGSRKRLKVNLDVYNVLNDSSITELNNNYGAAWRQPVGGAYTPGLMHGRLMQVGFQLTF